VKSEARSLNDGGRSQEDEVASRSVETKARDRVLPVQGPGREPERLLGIDLLRGLEQAPPQRREWTLLRALGQGPA
jgi:hypothetical protein